MSVMARLILPSDAKKCCLCVTNAAGFLAYSAGISAILETTDMNWCHCAYSCEKSRNFSVTF